jgi:hypothetical protein
MKFTLFITLLLVATKSFSADAYTRNYVIQASMTSYTGQMQPLPFWMSSYSSEKKPLYITNASGTSIMANPVSVVSAYDSTSTRFNVSNFYAFQNDRQKLIGHINGFTKGELFSIGYDSGVNAQKLNVNNAFYAGYTKTMSFSKSSLTSISFGSWFGGRVSESPCIDSYNRQYSCQTLTAWSDYHPSYPRPLAFIDLRHVWVFD